MRHQKKESVKDDGYYGHSSGRSYQGDNWYVSTPEQSVCKTSLGSFLGMCLDVHTALTLAALAILLQFIVSFTISSICPASTSSQPLILNINTTNVFNFNSEDPEDECPGGRNDDCEMWTDTDTRTDFRRSYQDLFPNLEDYTDLSGIEGYVSVDSEERRYDEERDPRRHDLLTTLREWLVRPSWQTVAKTFRESSFLSNSDPCKILRGFVSGYEVLQYGDVEKLIKKHTAADETRLFYVSSEDPYDVIKMAHMASGHGGRDRMKAQLAPKYANVAKEKSWLVVVLMGVVVAGEDGGEGGLQPLLGMFGSSWPQDSPRTSHPTHTPISDTNNYVNTSENHVTSLWYHDNFYSLTDKNGTIHKLLNKSIGTGILDKALDYLFNKLGTSYGGGQDDAHLGHHQLTPTWYVVLF
ncbi:SCAN domain-containing protein 3-like 14 [Homarus americanus]|uniref:SCAN domain-containing protein 3-like 14 n=1 Tax=Homarus americanus TaxID=6706 RepID=A0A8J5JLW7_HOMAM|nr:SCAN domain-containing protein 3-like 14 [Homarus americanus]